MLRPFALALSLFALPIHGFASVQRSCETIHPPGADPEWSLCISRDSQSASQDVVYYLHGLHQNEMSWESDYPGIRKYWADHGIQAPIIASISFGGVWLLSGQNGSKKSGLLEYVAEKVLPYLHRKLGKPSGRKILMGRSMGGFNGAQLLLKRPELFERVSLVCPALTNVSPWAPFKEITDYIKRTDANSFQVMKAILVSRQYFPDDSSWQIDAPLSNARDLIGMPTPPLQIMGDDHDSYGFQEGAELFARIAREQSPSEVRFEIHHGGHCDLDQASVARFIAGLPQGEI